MAGHKVTTDSGGSSHRDQLGQSDPILNTLADLLPGGFHGNTQLGGRLKQRYKAAGAQHAALRAGEVGAGPGGRRHQVVGRCAVQKVTGMTHFMG